MSPAIPTAERGTDTRVARTSRRYAIDCSRTRVGVRVRYAGLPVGGVFHDVSGEIAMPDDLRSTVASVTIDPDGFHAVGGAVRRRAAAALRADVGDSIRFGAVRMEPILESFVTHDGDRPLWALVGTLELGKVTRQIQVAVGVVRSIDDGGALAFSGTASLRRADLGIRPRAGLLGDTIRVRISGVAVRVDR